LATEAPFPRRGELRTRDVRVAYGNKFKALTGVDVSVLDAAHGVPVTARVELGDVRSGRSCRRALVCPSCRACRHLLLARNGRLACAGCHGMRLTRRQREHRTLNWRRGVKEEDALHRLLRPTVVRTKARLAEARRLVRDILAVDQARVRELRQQVADLELCVRAAG
jgi:hypothetical protein